MTNLNSILKLSVVAILLFASLGAAYYFVFDLPARAAKLQSRYQSCLTSEEINYSNLWTSNCHSYAEKSKRGFANCVASGLGRISCASVWGQADDSSNCSLPKGVAEDLEKNLEKEKERCLQEMKAGVVTPIDMAIPDLTSQNKAAVENAVDIIPPIKGSNAKDISPQMLATCLKSAANRYKLPPAVLIGIMQVEDGHMGEEKGPFEDGNYKLGPMQLSTELIPELEGMWNVDDKTARTWMRDDACVNVSVAAWVLKKQVVQRGTLLEGIAAYHSDNLENGEDYAHKVIKAMDEKGLIKHDAPLNMK